MNPVWEVVPVLCKNPTENINTTCGQKVVSVLNLAVCILTNELQSVGKATGRGMNDRSSNTRTNAFFFCLLIIIMSGQTVRLVQQYLKISEGLS